jgi:hypothetical protein
MSSSAHNKSAWHSTVHQHAKPIQPSVCTFICAPCCHLRWCSLCRLPTCCLGPAAGSKGHHSAALFMLTMLLIAWLSAPSS